MSFFEDPKPGDKTIPLKEFLAVVRELRNQGMPCDAIAAIFDLKEWFVRAATDLPMTKEEFFRRAEEAADEEERDATNAR